MLSKSRKQNEKQLKPAALIALICAVSVVPPVATDLFLPALPSMPAYFGESEATLNLVLVAFFICMAIGMLVLGPLSDKHGRKPVLLTSIGTFIVFSIVCALSSNVWVLITARVFQGFGGGGMVSIGTALVKDCFEGVQRARVLVAVMAIGVIAPTASPVLGAIILRFTTWQGTFVAQALFAICSLPLALLLKESLPEDERISDKLSATLGRLIVVAKNKSFIYLLIIASLAAACYMTYVSSASYIYIDYFHLSTLTYSIYFAVNSILSVLGALLVVYAQKHFKAKTSLTAILTVCLFSGVLILTIGSHSANTFLISYAFFTIAEGFIRPFTTNILLDQQKGDTGSASSLINTLNTAFSSGAMLLASAPFSTRIIGLGTCITISALIALAAFFLLMKSKIPIKGLK